MAYLKHYIIFQSKNKCRMTGKMSVIRSFMLVMNAHSEFITPFWLQLAIISDIKKRASTWTRELFSDILGGQCCESFQS